ncbi:MAG TPA: TldD/PmbA family protein [Thermoplasmata archaeon]|nr:TldD/PmbA family protein [Thermoplasmata archaeon]
MARRRPTPDGTGDPNGALRKLPSGITGDVRLISATWMTIRFANGRIHQPHLERSTQVSFRVADGRRLASATGSDASAGGLEALASTARALARIAPVEPKFPGFAAPFGRGPGRLAFSTSTASLSPEGATSIAEEILDTTASEAPGARTAGAVTLGSEVLRVVNSAGVDRTSTSSFARASVLVQRPDRDPPVSGWSEGAHWDASRLGATRLGKEAAERMAKTTPEPVEPGSYAVVLRGPAVADLVRFLAHLGFGANGEVEGWSCLAHRRGKRVAPQCVTLLDDARSRETIPQSIDYEGTWTASTPLIQNGIAGNVVTDLLTAGRLQRKLTGHAQPPEAPFGDYGPTPSHLLLEPGDATEEELVRETRRGLLVTRFHYVRVVDPGTGTITGMTRDGTYVIENGEVARPARNLRFTESVLTALAGISLLGKDRRIYSGEGAATVPAVATRAFRFTSATLF